MSREFREIFESVCHELYLNKNNIVKNNLLAFQVYKTIESFISINYIHNINKIENDLAFRLNVNISIYLYSEEFKNISAYYLYNLCQNNTILNILSNIINIYELKSHHLEYICEQQLEKIKDLESKLDVALYELYINK